MALSVKNLIDENFRITGITELAHLFAGSVTLPGEKAVDCTVGNGHDMLFLLDQVGPDGFVYGFDIQELAIENTRNRLNDSGIAPGRYNLIQDNHAFLKRFIKGPVASFMFNLGYLPGGDHSITTDSENVIRAVFSAAELLKIMGVITIVMYSGHPEGIKESVNVLEYAKRMESSRFRVMHVEKINNKKPSPSILIIQRVA